MPTELEWRWDAPTAGESIQLTWPANYTVVAYVRNHSSNPVICDQIALFEIGDGGWRDRVASREKEIRLASGQSYSIDATLNRDWIWVDKHLRIPKGPFKKQFTYEANALLRSVAAGSGSERSVGP